ncbi:hypothetical protein C1645_773695 [Glomus cerebriforme]|uniref:Uncharacterized protein n=1 Tax=Glomus cerebriforme TaxID=658196 RepID=A0A397SWC1_9GLOM|nr:hypothetical protein C1645_773695 [Glomus cerebriforme]
MWEEDLDNFLEAWNEILRQKQYKTKEVQVRHAEIPQQLSSESFNNKKKAKKLSVKKDDQNEAKVDLLIQDDDEMGLNSVDDNKNKKPARDSKRKSKVLDSKVDSDEKQIRSSGGRKNGIYDYFASVEGTNQSRVEKTKKKEANEEVKPLIQNDKGNSEFVDLVSDVEEIPNADKDTSSEELEFIRPPKRVRRKYMILDQDSEDEEISSLDEKTKEESDSKINDLSRDRGKRKAIDPDIEIVESYEVSEKPKKRPRSVAKAKSYIELSD